MVSNGDKWWQIVTTGFQVWFKPPLSENWKSFEFDLNPPKIEDTFSFGSNPLSKTRKSFRFRSNLSLKNPELQKVSGLVWIPHLKPERVPGFGFNPPPETPKGFGFSLKPSFWNPKGFGVWFKPLLWNPKPLAFGFGLSPPPLRNPKWFRIWFKPPFNSPLNPPL